MRIALDTNAYADFCRGHEAMVEAVQLATVIFIPYVVLAELRAGFLTGSRSLENERGLIRFLNSSRVQVLYADEQTTHQYARIFLQLRKQGTPVPTNDLWIAALVCQHDLILVSQDSHFDRLPQIPRFLKK